MAGTEAKRDREPDSVEVILGEDETNEFRPADLQETLDELWREALRDR